MPSPRFIASPPSDGSAGSSCRLACWLLLAVACLTGCGKAGYIDRMEKRVNALRTEADQKRQADRPNRPNVPGAEGAPADDPAAADQAAADQAAADQAAQDAANQAEAQAGQ